MATAFCYGFLSLSARTRSLNPSEKICSRVINWEMSLLVILSRIRIAYEEWALVGMNLMDSNWVRIFRRQFYLIKLCKYGMQILYGTK